MVVNDKKGDIAILRTLGASPASIMKTFIVQGALVGVIGTLAGLALFPSIANALGTALAAPAIVLLRGGHWQTAAGLALMAALLIWRHDANIRKLLAGTESRIGQRAKPAAGPPGN